MPGTVGRHAVTSSMCTTYKTALVRTGTLTA
jgi:hypothetical protein